MWVEIIINGPRLWYNIVKNEIGSPKFSTMYISVHNTSARSQYPQACCGMLVYHYFRPISCSTVCNLHICYIIWQPANYFLKFQNDCYVSLILWKQASKSSMIWKLSKSSMVFHTRYDKWKAPDLRCSSYTSSTCYYSTSID